LSFLHSKGIKDRALDAAFHSLWITGEE